MTVRVEHPAQHRNPLLCVLGQRPEGPEQLGLPFHCDGTTVVPSGRSAPPLQTHMSRPAEHKAVGARNGVLLVGKRGDSE